MSELNNARIQTLGAYIAIYDIECVDTKQQIYRGKRVVEPEQRDQVWPWYYSTRPSLALVLLPSKLPPRDKRLRQNLQRSKTPKGNV